MAAVDLANLGLSADASLEDVQRAYKRLALEHHPDRGGDKEAFQRIKAAADRLSGASRSDQFGSELVTHGSHECRDVIRCFLKLSGPQHVSVTLDEKQALMSTEHHKWVAPLVAAADEAFLCCCALHDDEQHVAIGSSRGRVHLVSSQCDTGPPPLDPIAAGDGPVLSLVCVSEHLPLLLASVAGRITLIDHAIGCALQSLESLASPFNGILAEALCTPPAISASAPSVLELRGGKSSTCADADALVHVCVAGLDDQRGKGVLLSLRMDLDALLLLEDDDEREAGDDTAAADPIRLDWRVAHDAPVYAMAAAEPSLLVAAAGHACILHQRETGCVLRRLAAGSGILYALALNPCNDCLLAAGSEEIVHVFNFPSGTKRAELHLPHGSARECSLNSAAINALAFVDDRTFVSGGYDATTTWWQLPQPPAVCGDSLGQRQSHPSATLPLYTQHD